MLIGVPREVKTDEARVALTATGATELVAHCHEVLVETGAVVTEDTVVARTELGLDVVGEQRLVVALRRDGHELGGERQQVGPGVRSLRSSPI